MGNASQRERGRRERALGLRGRGRLGRRGPCGGKERGGKWARRVLVRVERRRERGRGEWAAGLGCCSLFFPFLLFFFLSTLKLFKHFYLNSNEFELKPYTLNTIKTMLQHECTNKLIL
jgi:hypothetical protein